MVGLRSVAVDALDRQIARCEELVVLADEVIKSHNPGPSNYIGPGWVNAESFGEWRSRALTFLRDTFGDGHTYTSEFAEVAANERGTSPTKKGKGVLCAALADLKGGYLQGLRRLVVAEVFADFLGMAEHLHAQGYHHAAVSVAGAVLEDGLRRVAAAHQIAVKARDDLTSLNSRLAEKVIYDRLTQKEVGVWIDLRNAADHGDWDKVTAERAGELLRGIGRFLERYTSVTA